MDKQQENRPDDQDLFDHLEELRTRLIRILLFFVSGFVIAYIFHQKIVALLLSPVIDGLKAEGIYYLQALSIIEGIMTYIKASAVAGLILSMPLILREVWLFIKPALKETEKHVVLSAFFVIAMFFAAGVVFSYLIFVPLVVKYLASINPHFTQLVPRLSDIFSIALIFYVVFGFVFEVPLIMFILTFLGIFTATQYIKYSRYFIVLSFILGAMFSPPDPLSQILIAVPLCILYGLGILASLSLASKKNRLSPLHILTAMSIFLLTLSLLIYALSSIFTTHYITKPPSTFTDYTCIFMVDNHTFASSISQKGFSFTIKNHDRTFKGLLFTKKCPQTYHRVKDICIQGPKIPDTYNWIDKLKPDLPAIMWVKTPSKHKLIIKASTNPSGILITIKNNPQDLPYVIRILRSTLPCKDWPVESSTKTTKTWIPSIGASKIIHNLFSSFCK